MSSPPQLCPRTSHLSPYPHANSFLRFSDPRTSSTQSLVPSEAPVSKRKLLLVYIHGFYGNDQSFQSFPAHLHALLKELLVDTHVIHSKIYPRYKTYKAIEVARDNFSAWLEPHEHDGTDVVLVGHSMGGLLAGEVVLMPNANPHKKQPFKHRILGTVAMDSPFLGLHPGIVVSGIASLFQHSPNQGDLQQQRLPGQEDPSTPCSSKPSSSTERLPFIGSDVVPTDTGPSPRPQRQSADPYFDPPYYNDAPFREKPFVKRLINFTTKHKREGLLNAVRRHITSHLEFGACLADYPGLHERYNRLRALEDVDEIKKMTEGHPTGAHARVRLVNYYTLCPGRPKTVKVDDEASQDMQAAPLHLAELDVQDLPVSQSPHPEMPRTPGKEVKTTTKSVANPDSQIADAAENNAMQDSQNRGEEQHEILLDNTLKLTLENSYPISMQNLDPSPLAETESQSQTTIVTDDLDLPLIPDLPCKPILPDIDAISDKEAKKQAQRESKRLEKAYTQAIKHRVRAAQERDKMREKRRKKAAKEAEKQTRDAEKTRAKQERQEQKKRACEQRQAGEPVSVEGHGERGGNEDAVRPKKLKKFCALPSLRGKARDAAWIDVYMDGLDEVGAHCGLFLPGPHYDGLVGDVGSRIAAWVGDELTKRAILEAG
ncbi:uncharacterized protein MAM_00509 [Metarhizium album ARSEF 1941]|uniref:DUF676 domain-containing protein n=1 Tax=Metarhizium album (strain ARSEF 1941) TaxID=1081103 RepID=A0A0B2X6W4_METAS|nr:uncharacterized protein MAM_00509 [Metarhizium album ARSEF 1941]KHO01508.1 hypothetical protein MAM_00509 [Metarhizium album ARSEF 1941]